MKKLILSLVALLILQSSVEAQVMFFPLGWQDYKPMPVGPPKIRVIETDPYKLLIAESMLLSKKEFSFPHSPAAYDYWARAVETVALQLEILDPRENRYVLSQPQDFNADLKLLQGRYHELRDAPFVAEQVRFPECSMVNEMMAFNRAYRADLVNRLTLDTIHENELRAALAETDQLYRIWDAVRDFKCDYYYITVKRQAAKTLRELIGAEAYYSGNLPPHVPIWRFPVWEGP